ncbi:MAG: SUMF1/EgtB/PvdO family nonheme iron enzyme, partial [Pseudomonadales bacterium]|nr:SUMF1/EgtB/PvdO family nonheme iron enzyme [Pseudomonadales bacterium]
YGLYDMSGNVWEWMSDCGDRQCGANTRSLRGGGWINQAEDLRIAKRNHGDINKGFWESGFRLARSLPDGDPVLRDTSLAAVDEAPKGLNSQNELACASMVQGKVAWNRAGNTNWQPVTIERLCRGTNNPSARIGCFEASIQAHDQWALAINECTAAGRAE